MNPLENKDVNIDNLLNYYFHELRKEYINMNRIKKFYNDENSFNELMNKIIQKDYNRFEKLINNSPLPNPWRILFVVINIVQYDGEEIEPYDVLTRTFPSKSMKYMGWTFSWVNGDQTMISIYNREDELIYRF